jgi:hypothetical protein
MPRDAITLADVREPMLTIVCGRCGRCSIKRLIASYGADARLPDLLATLANCKQRRSFGIHDRCKAKFEGVSFRS